MLLKLLILVPIGLLLTYLILLFINQFTYLHGATKGEKINANNMPNSALLVIDIQNVLPPADDKLQAKSPQLYKYISHLNSVIDHITNTGEKVIYIAQVKEANSLRSLFMPHVPLRGSEKAQIHSGLHANNPTVFTKLIGDAFSNPELQQYLKKHGIGRLYIAGMAAEVCVNFTIQGAINRGYQVNVIEDAVIALFGPKSKQKKLQQFSKLGAKIITSNALTIA